MRILFILTNHKDGLWLSELTHPHRELVGMGCEVDFATLLGGAAVVSPYSDPDFPLSMEKNDATSREFLRDAVTSGRIKETTPLADVSGDDYDAIHLVGGLGTAHDFYPNADLGRLIAEFWAMGKAVSAICHGVIGLANARVDDVALVRGRRVTSYSLEEDKELEKLYSMQSPVVPHYPQAVLEGEGALFEARPSRTPHIVRDGKLLTGQNQQSSTMLAVALAGLLRGD